MSRIIPLNLLVWLCVAIGHATHPICTVTWDPAGYYYKIVGDNKPPCDFYDWTRETNLVLANHYQSVSDNAVQLWNDTYLHLRMCVEDITRNRNCPREDHVLVVQCSVNCSKGSEISTESSEISKGRRHVFVIPPLLLFLTLLFLLIYRFVRQLGPFQK